MPRVIEIPLFHLTDRINQGDNHIFQKVARIKQSAVKLIDIFCSPHVPPKLECYDCVTLIVDVGIYRETY
jgi:hypothetical protein